MKRHTTRKRNRLLKRMAARRAWELCEAEQSIRKWLSYKIGREIERMFYEEFRKPTGLDALLSPDSVTVNAHDFAISPTVEYRGVE